MRIARIVTNLFAAILSFAGIGVVGFSVALANLYQAQSAIQEAALYAMATHFAVVGVGLILCGGILTLAWYAHEISITLQHIALR